MVLGKLTVPGRPTTWIPVGQGPAALAVGAGGGYLDVSSILFSPLSPSLWETARYRLKYCLKGPLNPKQPTNQLLHSFLIHSLVAEGHSSCFIFTAAGIKCHLAAVNRLPVLNIYFRSLEIISPRI